MTLKKQWKTIKDNWLLALLMLLVLVGNPFAMFGATTESFSSYDMGYGMEESVAMARVAPSPAYGGDFAPEVEERKITKNTQITTEVEYGTFDSAQAQFKNAVSAADAILLSDYVQNRRRGRYGYLSGMYQLKVSVDNYDMLVAQLQEIGEVQTFRETSTDITGQYVNAEINLETEKARLARYKALYAEAERVEDKIELNDRIFNQERTVKYLEDAMKNMDTKVEYSTISFTLNEKQSDYADVIFVEFSSLVKSLVNSVNDLLTFVFWILPWALAFLLLRKLWKWLKKKKLI